MGRLPPQAMLLPALRASERNSSTVCRWLEDTRGPTWVSDFAGSPRISFRVVATNFSRKGSYMLFSTNNRLRAQQSWPVLAKTLMGDDSAARAQSESAKTIFGDLPPSSSETRLRSFDASRMILRPISVEP